MKDQEIRHHQGIIRAAQRFVSCETSRMIHLIDAFGFYLTNIQDHPDSESFSEANQEAVTELCRRIATKVTDLSEWVDSASSMLPEPFNNLSETTFTMGVDDQLIDDAVAAKTQKAKRFWDQLDQDEPERRRDDEGRWIENAQRIDI